MRVAAYIRVSTDTTDQENSYEMQERYFYEAITQNPSWTFAGIYCDYGISGATKEQRIGFQRLMRHCQEGKIQRILCKSISRFSRNTQDFLQALDTLKKHQVSILFEKENIDTAKPENGFVLTAMGALAQQESLNISENVRWSNQKRYPKGQVSNIPIYGYRYAEEKSNVNGYWIQKLVVVEEEAKVVQRIFQLASEGESYCGIARILNGEGIVAPRKYDGYVSNKKGKLKPEFYEGWTGKRISQILRLERYAGIVLTQKTYTKDFLNHKVYYNQGELSQYEIRNHHPAIISKELFEQVQKKRKSKGERSAFRPFSQRILCGQCGRFFHARNHRNGVSWYCPSANLNNGMKICSMKKIQEEQLIYVVGKGIVERYELLFSPAVVYEDVMEQEDWNQLELFSAKADTFIEKMCIRLEHLDEMSHYERDRSFLWEKIQEAKESRVEKKILEKQLAELEAYWEMVEADYKWRQKAIIWMRELPAGANGMKLFFKGLSSEYIRAFVLFIEMDEVGICKIHWFDDTKTIVKCD